MHETEIKNIHMKKAEEGCVSVVTRGPCAFRAVRLCPGITFDAGVHIIIINPLSLALR